MSKPVPLPKHFVGKKTCERYGAQTKICIEGNKYGFSGTFVSDKGGKLPISFGTDNPRTPAEAMKSAKRFLARIHGKNN